MAYESKYVNSLKVDDTKDIIYKGQSWISFYNSGNKKATIKSYDDKGVVRGTWTLPAGGTYNLGEDKDFREWGKFEIDATGTVVEATFENPNIER